MLKISKIRASWVLGSTVALLATTVAIIGSGNCTVHWSCDDEECSEAIESNCEWNETEHRCSPGCGRDTYSHNEGCVASAYPINTHCATDSSRGDPPGTLHVTKSHDYWPCREPDLEPTSCWGCDLSGDPITDDPETVDIGATRDYPGCGG